MRRGPAASPAVFRPRVPALLAFGLALIACASVLLATPAPAPAYQQAGDPRGVLPCERCHTSWSGGSDPGNPGSGPHGRYSTTSKKCDLCHKVHTAVGSMQLLPADTVSASCFTCHDATGAYAVYGEVLARTGIAPAAAHSIEATNVVPGGSPLTQKLTCTSCHSPHGSTKVEPFPQMKQFAAEVGWPVPSNRLLRDDVGGKPKGTFTKYGGAWCAGCHDQRSGSLPAVHNHPTTETAESAGVFGADTYPDLLPSEFVMEDVASPPTPRHAPYCQQCHWNAVDVQAAVAVGYFTYDFSRPDLPGLPAVAAFPHETQNPRMTIQSGDALCLDCHAPGKLP